MHCIYFLIVFFYCSVVMGNPYEPVSSLRVSIEQDLTPHLSNLDRRDPNEMIKVRENVVEIWRYESFERGDLERKLCAAVRSLIFGRLPSNKGIKSIFNQHQSLREVSLIFYRLDTSVTPNLNGFYEQSQQVTVTARLTLQRPQVFPLILDQLDRTLQGSRCVTQAKNILSDLWISETIVNRRELLKVAEIEIRARHPLKQTVTPNAAP